MNEILRIENLYVSYGSRSVLEGLNLVVKKGETVAILGQNGAGKSTLLKSIMGLVGITGGKIYFKGKNITNIPVYKKRDIGIGYFPQDGAVFEDLSVGENLRIAGKDLTKKEYNDKIELIKEFIPFIEKVDKKKMAYSLSGGEKHLLALSMVLMGDMDLLLLDEPSAGLSPANVDIMYKTLNRIKEIKNITILLAEQRVNEAVNFSDVVCLLRNGVIEMEERDKDWNDIEEMFFGK